MNIARGIVLLLANERLPTTNRSTVGGSLHQGSQAPYIIIVIYLLFLYPNVTTGQTSFGPIAATVIFTARSTQEDCRLPRKCCETCLLLTAPSDIRKSARWIATVWHKHSQQKRLTARPSKGTRVSGIFPLRPARPPHIFSLLIANTLYRSPSCARTSVAPRQDLVSKPTRHTTYDEFKRDSRIIFVRLRAKK